MAQPSLRDFGYWRRNPTLQRVGYSRISLREIGVGYSRISSPGDVSRKTSSALEFGPIGCLRLAEGDSKGWAILESPIREISVGSLIR